MQRSARARLTAAAALTISHVATADVLQHHADAARSGTYTAPDLGYARAEGLKPDRRFDGRVAGAINAQPLYVERANGAALVIVATETNAVAALDARTGEAVWRRTLGAPASRSRLPCGNIAPLGVTGTPVIDPGRAALYLDAAVSVDGGLRHEVFGLSVADGSTLPGWPIDVQAALERAGKRFDPRVQNQRGALAIADDTLYVPYGGHFGDCGDYHGWVVGLPLDRPDRVSAFETRAEGGGIWAPGGIAVAGGSLLVATGNTFGARQWQDGEAVLRLAPGLDRPGGPRDYFAAADWRSLDARDLDLGGANPLPLTVPGGEPSSLVLAMGKDGNAYLLGGANLGGIGGALRVVSVSRTPIRTSPVTYTTAGKVFVVFQGRPRDCPAGQGGDVGALRIDPGAPPSARIAWCADAHGRGAPMATTTGEGRAPIVWIVGAEGDNRLHAFAGDTGRVLFDGRGSEMHAVAHFQVPIAAGGRIYVAGDGRIYAFVY